MYISVAAFHDFIPLLFYPRSNTFLVGHIIIIIIIIIIIT